MIYNLVLKFFAEDYYFEPHKNKTNITSMTIRIFMLIISNLERPLNLSWTLCLYCFSSFAICTFWDVFVFVSQDVNNVFGYMISKKWCPFETTTVYLNTFPCKSYLPESWFYCFSFFASSAYRKYFLAKGSREIKLELFHFNYFK